MPRELWDFLQEAFKIWPGMQSSPIRSGWFHFHARFWVVLCVTLTSMWPVLLDGKYSKPELHSISKFEDWRHWWGSSEFSTVRISIGEQVTNTHNDTLIDWTVDTDVGTEVEVDSSGQVTSGRGSWRQALDWNGTGQDTGARWTLQQQQLMEKNHKNIIPFP